MRAFRHDRSGPVSDDRRSRGFTLVEALTVLVLFLLLIAMTGQIMQAYGTSFRRLQRQGQDSLTGLLLLQSLRDELEQCQAVLDPGPGSTSNELTFQLIDPDFDPIPEPPFPATSPFVLAPPARLATIRYHLVSRQVWREATLGGTTTGLMAGEPFDSFSCQRLGDDNLELTLTVSLEGRVLECKSRVYRPRP